VPPLRAPFEKLLKHFSKSLGKVVSKGGESTIGMRKLDHKAASTNGTVSSCKESDSVGGGQVTVDTSISWETEPNMRNPMFLNDGHLIHI
jgi:hypothetical protein